MFILLALLFPLLAAPAKAPPKLVRTDDGIVIGPCGNDSDCEVQAPSACCSSCRGAPRVARKGKPASPACGCKGLEPKPAGASCPAVESADLYRAVCTQQVCKLRVRKPVFSRWRPIARPAKPADSQSDDSNNP
jgi:hypothetical protein